MRGRELGRASESRQRYSVILRAERILASWHALSFCLYERRQQSALDSRLVVSRQNTDQIQMMLALSQSSAIDLHQIIVHFAVKLERRERCMSSNRKQFSLSCQLLHRRSLHRRSLTFNRLLWNDAQNMLSFATRGPSHRDSILESFASEIIEVSDLLFETWGVLDVRSWHCWYVGLSDTKSEILSRLTFRHFLTSVLFHDQFSPILHTFVAAMACFLS